jgi:hypothetical protein
LAWQSPVFLADESFANVVATTRVAIDDER